MPSSSAPSQQDIRAVNEAAAWYVRLRSETATVADRQAWAHWLNDDAAHRSAWNKVEQVCRQLGRVPAHIAVPALTAASASRRAVLRTAGLVLAAGSASWIGWRVLPWRNWTADYRSNIGERRHIQLADGSSLTLDTHTAVDVRFDALTRLLDLRSGAILVSTHPDPNAVARPFVVRTDQGTVTALGTRFIVRQEDDRTHVAVLEKAVRIQPVQSAHELVLRAGQQVRFDTRTIDAPRPSEQTTTSWTTGSLVVLDMPLRQLATELGRYRRGGLGCDERIAELLVSGSFPLDNTDQALAALTQSFPIRTTEFLGYWTRLVPR